MKNLRSIFVLSGIVISVMAAAGTAVGQWGGGPVVVYDQRNGGGASQSFNIGVFLNNRGQFGSLRNDSAASVTVEPGYRVRLCESEGAGNGSGRCEEFADGSHNLRYNGAASYIRVWTTGRGQGGWGTGPGNSGVGSRGVTVFEDRNFRGRSQSFGAGRYSSSGGNFGGLRNDEASSIVVDRGFRVRLCESEGGGVGAGRCEEYTEGRHNLNLNDEASYIEVRRAGGGWGGGGIGTGPGPGWGGGGVPPGGQNVIVYSENNQKGEQQMFNIGTFRNDRNQLGNLRNDDANSIYVPRGYRIRLCDSEAGGRGSGRCEEYGPGSFELRHKDTASFIRVWRSGY